ncbi:unnamed protein product [Spirodela intermedia]|uniref:Protein kinase domain-containing protein n=1 Tax=Spirodela intermedia TaxID=51605 RepID=A0A7I8IAA5_SPIIN|nr:unnamed protein product [Spirodela intermedia]CAA6654605.1 unnamed protein product [Spirodela intermedia]
MFSGENPGFSAGAHAVLNKDSELGRGGFGAVYKTVLCDGRPVAIKKLTVSSLVKSQEDFEREVKKLGKLHHPNLVTLEGYYWTPSLQLLIYEYVSGQQIQSALGYMAPEFACRTVKVTEKCDVYGFGVLVLEVVTGKRPVEYMEDDVVMLCDTLPPDEAVPIMKLGLICTSQVPSTRPEMSEVVNILEMIRSPQDSSQGEELG